MVGLALATTDLTASISQIPSGLLIDKIRYKRLLLGLACFAIALACGLIISFPDFSIILLAQALIGISAALIPPSIAAITLGLVGRKLFPKRVSLNETWSHTGNVFTAALVGGAGYLLGLNWIIYLVMICALLSICFLSLIRSQEINDAAARELTNGEDSQNQQPLPIRKLLRESPLLIFCFSVFLFHFSNAAQLPLIGQYLSQKNQALSSLFMVACILLAQFVMIGVAYLMGSLMNRVGRKPLFLIALGVLPLRALLFAVTTNPYFLLTIQMLDGISAGIFGVIAIVTISDIAKGSGRFNFSIGLMALFQGVGASGSNGIAGYLANQYGYGVGFLTLASLALIGFTFYGLFMPETKEVH